MDGRKLSDAEQAAAAEVLRKMSDEDLTELFLFGETEGLCHLAMAEMNRRERDGSSAPHSR